MPKAKTNAKTVRKVVLVYHSVYSESFLDRQAGLPPVGAKGIPMERFKLQIMGAKFRGWQFRPVSALRHKAEADTLYVTGDDGLSDWANLAVPWCTAQRIPVHSAIIAGPWCEQPIYPVAHRLQIALATRAERLVIPEMSADQRRFIDRVYRRETDETRRAIKGMVDYFLSADEIARTLGRVTNREAIHLASRFADPDKFRHGLSLVGCHGVTHRPYRGKDDLAAYVEMEVLPGRGTILRHGLSLSPVFTLPLAPAPGAALKPLENELRRLGFEGMFHGSGEWNGKDFTIPRIDATDVEKALGLPEWTNG